MFLKRCFDLFFTVPGFILFLPLIVAAACTDKARFPWTGLFSSDKGWQVRSALQDLQVPDHGCGCRALRCPDYHWS